MRILILDNAPFIGGAQVNFRHMAPLLRERGFDVSFAIATTADPRALRLYEQLGLDVDLIPMGKSGEGATRNAPIQTLRALRSLTATTRRRRTDVVFASSQRAGFLAAMLTLFGISRSVWRLCDMEPPVGMRAMTAFVSRAACVSEAVYRKYRGLPRGHFSVVYTGVWAPDYDPDAIARRRRELRTALGIPVDAFVVGSVSNLQYWKGLHVVLQAFHLALAEGPNSFLVHIGGPVAAYPTYPQRIDTMIAELGLREHVRRLGYVADPLPYYAAFDAFVHLPVPEPGFPEPEAFGQVTAEAMAYRVPVVASEVGGLSEVVDAGSGFLVPAGSADAAAAALVRLMTNKPLRQAAGEHAFQRFRERFTIERETDDYCRLFAELA